MNRYNTVIIGGGLGGLLCGVLLSKKGQKICVLEKHKHIGGNLQGFIRKGQYFDTGMHYIGNHKPGSILHSVFEIFGINPLLKLQELDKTGFDIITFSGKEYKFAIGFENFANQLIEYFPDEKNGIIHYTKTVEEIYQSLNLETLYAPIFENKYLCESAYEFIKSCVTNPILQNILAGNAPLYAGDKNKTSLYMHALISGFFIDDASRFVGGSHGFADQLAAKIEENGGIVKTDSEIVSFEFDDSQIISCRDSKGEIYEADNFISAIHPAVLFKIIPEHKLRKAYRKRIENLENSTGIFTVYAIMKPESFPYINSNHYVYKTDDVWLTPEKNNIDYPGAYFLMSAADTENQNFATAVKIMTYMTFEELCEWENTFKKKRGEEYEKFKIRKAEALLSAVNEKFHGFREKISEYYTSTPLTFRDYTATPQGSGYGIVRDFRNQDESYIPVRTKIPNLFLTGQNINIHGILGVSIVSLLTCSAVLNVESIK
jgi:all-trans-retinol 13,14-reductase